MGDRVPSITMARCKAVCAEAAAVTSSLLIGNLHCPTCVSAIKEALHEANPRAVRWVSPNIVTSVVTVQHLPVASVRDMTKTLEEIGFEVCGVTSSDADAQLPELAHGSDAGSSSRDKDASSGSWKEWLHPKTSSRSLIRSPSSKARTHLQNCEQCRKSSTGEAPDEKCCADTRTVSVPPGPAAKGSETGQGSTAHPQAVMSEKSFVTIDGDAPSGSTEPTWRASIAVGGMTCAVCVNTITDELKKREYITKTVINLVSNSATVEFLGKSNADRILAAIEDIGYEATLDSVVGVDEEKPKDEERTVEIFIEGMYCEHCPDRVTSSLAGFRRNLDIAAQPTAQRPIMKVTYTPVAPVFTIRQILAAIDACDPALKASIYHPPTLEERSRQIQLKHQKQILYRVILTGIVAIPTFIIGIVYMSLLPDGHPGKHHLMSPWTSGISRAQIALLIMATPIYFFAADIFHVRALKEIQTLWRRGSRTPILQRFYRFGSMNTLMSLGTTIAYISSVSQMIAAAAYRAPEVNSANFYFDSVVFLTLFLLVGRLIESYSKSRTGDAVDMLAKLRPTIAVLVEMSESGETSSDSVVQADLLDVGDIVRVPHGGSPPADGLLIRGETSFDESSLTGESRLVKKSVGDQVFAGTVNKDVPILVRITGVSGRSMLDQIVTIVREGQTKRAPVEQIADVLTTYFVPFVTLVAVATWIIWLSLGLSGVAPAHYLDVTSGGWVAFSLQFAIAVFVVACPCGLALAAPTAIFVGGGLAAKHGILAKGGGEAFEKASRVDCVVFDKTGTLTQGGEPKITDAEFYPDGGGDERHRQTLLAALKAVEENSSHPIAKAVVAFCASRTAEHVSMVDLQEIPGKGMKATYEGPPDESFDIIVGNEALMHDFSVGVPPAVVAALRDWKEDAKSVALAATRRAADARFAVAAALAVSDPIRPEAAAVVRSLSRAGAQVWMLSGDNAVTARAVARRVGIAPDRVLAEVLPRAKHERIKYLQGTQPSRSRGHGRATVAMVGDGVNDSAALATADVGVAIGSGSDVAIGSAGFVLVTADLRGVVALLALSRAVLARVRLNFAWALVYNMVALPVAAGALYPVVTRGGAHVRLDPVWASLAMALSSISVVTSSLLLRSRVPGVGFRPPRVVVDGEEAPGRLNLGG